MLQPPKVDVIIVNEIKKGGNEIDKSGCTKW